MLCEKCGNQVAENAKFCRTCGAKIETGELPQETVPPAPAWQVQPLDVPKKKKVKKLVIGLAGGIADTCGDRKQHGNGWRYVWY